MPVYLRDGQLLLVNGQLATGEGCCCGDSLCCTCGVVLLTHVARYDGFGDSNTAAGLAPTETDALASQAAHIAATGWGRPVAYGGAGGDGMSLSAAAAALADYGCGDTVTIAADPPYYDAGLDGWVVPLPYLSVRCCGTSEPEGGPYEDPSAVPLVLKPDAIDTWPWLVEGAAYREVLFPCVDDGSNVFCMPCSDSIPACQSGSCTGENLPCGSACTGDIGMGSGSTACAETECCTENGCVPGYWVMDVGDCVCSPGATPEGYEVDPPAGALANPGNYVWTTWSLCCQERIASGFPACGNPFP